MFLLIILSCLDLLTAIMLISAPFDLFPFRLVLGGALYLLLKAYMFRGDFLSLMDGVIGVYLFIAFFLPWPFLCYFLGAWLFIKSFYALATSFAAM